MVCYQGIYNQLFCQKVDCYYSSKCTYVFYFLACSTRPHTAYSNRMNASHLLLLIQSLFELSFFKIEMVSIKGVLTERRYLPWKQNCLLSQERNSNGVTGCVSDNHLYKTSWKWQFLLIVYIYSCQLESANWQRLYRGLYLRMAFKEWIVNHTCPNSFLYPAAFGRTTHT